MCSVDLGGCSTGTNSGIFDSRFLIAGFCVGSVALSEMKAQRDLCGGINAEVAETAEKRRGGKNSSALQFWEDVFAEGVDELLLVCADIMEEQLFEAEFEVCLEPFDVFCEVA